MKLDLVQVQHPKEVAETNTWTSVSDDWGCPTQCYHFPSSESPKCCQNFKIG